MATFANIADVLNAQGVQVFPVKGQPGRFTVSFVNAKGQRQFIDRRPKTVIDGKATEWAWVLGRDLTPRAAATEAKASEAITVS